MVHPNDKPVLTMPNGRFVKLLVGGVVGAVAVLAAETSIAADHPATRQPGTPPQASFALLTENAVAPGSIQEAYKLPSGTGVGVATGNGLRCVVLTHNDGNGNDGDCASAEEIARGEEVLVFDRCRGPLGSRIIVIAVPSFVRGVRLDRSDGTISSGGVVNGTVAFEQRLGPGSRTKVRKITWLSATGRVVHRQSFLHGVPAGCARRTAAARR